MPLYTLAIVAGALLAFYANALPDSAWFMYAPLLAWLARMRPSNRFLLLSASAYLWSSAVFHYHLDHRLAPSWDNRISLVQGRVVDVPEVDSGRVRFYLRPDAIDGYVATLPRLLRLNWYQDRVLPRAGETWQFETRLRRPGGAQNPSGFDYAAWQFVHGIDAGGYVRDSSRNRRLRAAAAGSIDRWREALATGIDRLCPDCEYRGLIKALAIGYRGDIDVEQRRILQASGTAHLLAISGLHIGIVALFGTFAGRLCWRLGLYRHGFDRGRCTSLFALIGAAGYALLAGFSLPTLRALIMFCALLLALQFRNRINLLQSVSLAVAVILLCDPRAIGSVSLWLSLSAMLVIAFAGFRLGAPGAWWRQLVALQFFFALLFLPLGLSLFGRINPASFPANLVAIPLVSFILLPLVLLAAVGVALGAGWAHWLLALADTLLALLLGGLDRLARGYLDSIAFAALPPLLLGSILVALLIWLVPGGWRLRLVATLVLLFALGWKPAGPEQNGFELTILDVGMGTSVLVRTREHNLVYDFGSGKPGVYSVADHTLLPLLQDLGIGQPDLLIVSHVDQDHSGGLQSFLGRYVPARLLSGTPSRLEARFGLEHRVRSCHDYPAWRWDGVDFRFLAPSAANRVRGSNNRSCILQVSGYQRVLLPGDIEAVQEARLLAHYGDELEADILLAPHHGSATSSSPRFIQAVAPRYVVYTVSRNNRWGFPRPAVSARYAARGSRQFRTDNDGAIRIRSAAKGLSIETFGSPPRRLWRRW